MTTPRDQRRQLLPPPLLEALLSAGIEPEFDAIMRDFLVQSANDLLAQCRRGGLLTATAFGKRAPWLWMLEFATRGLVRDADDEPTVVSRHVVGVRFPVDYLRRANRFEILAMLEPRQPPAFHPNISPDGMAVCVDIYPGEPLTEIAQSVHAIISGRLKTLDERDALNRSACEHWRKHITEPIDDRPLFGSRPQMALEIS